MVVVHVLPALILKKQRVANIMYLCISSYKQRLHISRNYINRLCLLKWKQCYIYAVQQDTQSVSVSEFIQHLF